MKSRKNINGGCVLRMPCFCAGDRPAAAACCPVHVLWQAVRGRVPPSSLLFSAVNARNFNRTLRDVLRKLIKPGANRYSSHGFRRGTAQALKENGSPWEAVATDGVWNSPAFRGYLGLTDDVEHGCETCFRPTRNRKPTMSRINGPLALGVSEETPLGGAADFPMRCGDFGSGAKSDIAPPMDWVSR